MKKTQRKLVEQGIRYHHLTGSEITDEVIDFFLQCYQATYLKRSGHTGYLNETFFRQLRNTMAKNMLIVTAYKHDSPIASALFFFDDTGLYGRYWGALEEVSGLHFAISIACTLHAVILRVLLLRLKKSFHFLTLAPKANIKFFVVLNLFTANRNMNYFRPPFMML